MEFITLFESIRPVDTPSIIFAFLGLSVLIIPKNKIDKQTILWAISPSGVVYDNVHND